MTASAGDLFLSVYGSGQPVHKALHLAGVNKAFHDAMIKFPTHSQGKILMGSNSPKIKSWVSKNLNISNFIKIFPIA